MRYLLITFCLGFAACTQLDENGNIGRVRGWAPIYATAQAAADLSVGPPKPTVVSGKIYAYGNYLFQVDNGTGIHIIDNANPATAEKIAFLNVASATEVAIKSGYLYVNHLDDLVTFNLGTPGSPQLVSRVENAFPQFSQSYPGGVSGYFECPDPAKGVVIGWEEKMIENPKCRR